MDSTVLRSDETPGCAERRTAERIIRNAANRTIAITINIDRMIVTIFVIVMIADVGKPWPVRKASILSSERLIRLRIVPTTATNTVSEIAFL